MSYEILYGRQFVKLPDNKILPVILCGSSNCTMFRHGREVLERSWCCFGNFYNLTEKGLLHKVNDIVCNSESNSEWFKSGGKWITNENILGWIKNGIASARTIEEIHEITHEKLHCYLSSWVGYSKQQTLSIYATTSEELVEWLEKVDAKIASDSDGSKKFYVNTSFGTYEPLRLGKKSKKAKTGPVICKTQHGYLVRNDERSFTTTRDKFDKDIIIFESEEDFKNKIKGTFLERSYSSYRLISGNRPEKNFAVKINGSYLYKLSKTHLFYTCVDSAKRFTSKNAADKYVQEMIMGKFASVKEYEVINLKE